MSSVDLESTLAKADKGLERQRPGLDGSDAREDGDGSSPSSFARVGRSPSVGILGAPGEKRIEMVAGTGLVPHDGGWMYVCEFGDCPNKWTTRVVPIEQISVLVRIYELHVAQCHDPKKDGTEQDKFAKDQASYQEATKLKTIEAHEDNRVDVLSPARFLPMPLRHRYIAEQQPANQVPVWDRLDLDHLGLHIADTSIISKMHNRTYAGAKLEHFSPTNLGMNENDKDLTFRPSSGGGMRSARSTKSISSIPEAVGALMNFEEIWRRLHPLVYGSRAIVIFLMDRINHQSSDRKLTSVRSICNFFQAAVKGNADRVLGPEHPRTYQEIVTFYNSMDWPGAGAPSSSNLDKEKPLKRQNTEAYNRSKKNAKTDVCFAFNSASGCGRSSGETCAKNGVVFKHYCNYVDGDGKMCAAKDHGKQGHP